MPDASEHPDWSELPDVDEDEQDADDDRLDDLEDAKDAARRAEERAEGQPARSELIPTYNIESTSLQTADVAPIPLSLRQNPDGSTWRRVITPKVLGGNPKNPAATLQIKIHQQRRANLKKPWQDVKSFQTPRLKAGEEVSLDLHSEEVLLLYNHLTNLYAVAKDGVKPGARSVQVVDQSRGVALFAGQEAQLLTQLVQQYGNDDLFAILRKLKPNLLSAAGIAAVHEKRTAAVKQFEDEMNARKWSETEWYPFFEVNPWILGHGLNYRFLQNVQKQPAYGGLAVTGRGIQRGDILMATAAAIRFSVLVEVKRPDTRLLEDAIYRNGAYSPGEHLSGGVAQLQANCRTWAIEGSKLEGNEALGIETYEPKGILVIGDLREFHGNEKRERTRSFELFRRNLHNPDVITFDELLERARYLVATAAPGPAII
jgi:hypothetical protein